MICHACCLRTLSKKVVLVGRPIHDKRERRKKKGLPELWDSLLNNDELMKSYWGANGTISRSWLTLIWEREHLSFIQHIKFPPPWVRSHLHLVGSRPSHASFVARSSCPNMHGNSSSLGTNVRISGQSYIYSSWHHFHYSQIKWCSSFHMAKGA